MFNLSGAQWILCYNVAVFQHTRWRLMTGVEAHITRLQTLVRTRLAVRLDSGLTVTLALCLFALWPLLARPGLPNGDDVLYHVYRAAEMDRSWSHGVLMPRWAETFYTGYGAPLFHYYASLTYYVTSIFMRLLAPDAVNSLRLLIALCMLGSGAGMYAFIRRYAGNVGGIIAALCYVYSPYLLFTESYSRGAYPELVALALFPALMWSYSRLLHQETSRSATAFILAAALEGALIISHNLMALVMTGLLVAWLVWSLLAHVISCRVSQSVSPSRDQLHLYLLALLAVTLGIGLAGYFWIPVVSEGHAVKLANLTGVAELNYRNFFVPVIHLLEPNPRPDAGALNGLEHRLNLGVPQWTLALTGIIGIVILWTLRRIKHSSNLYLIPHTSYLNILFFTLTALVLIALILSASAPVWELLVPLAYLQFPWRLLGPAVFCLSVLAGMNALWLERLPRRFGGAFTAGIVVFAIGMASPTLYVTEWVHETVDTSVAAYHEAELRGWQRATTFSNEYLPATVAVEPGATPRLLADYADGYPVNKAHFEALPSGVTVEALEHGPQHDIWRVSASAPFTMEVLTYAFPGWTAEIDGQSVPITPSDPHGLITFPVPAGDHTVRLYLGSTPARDWGNAITITAILGTLGVSLAIYSLSANSQQPTANRPPLIPHPSHLIPFVLGGIITLAFLFLYAREGGAWVHSPPGEALLAQHQTTYNLGEQIQLIGYDVSGRVFRPGERLEVAVYWYAREQPDYGYSSFVHLTNGGPPVAQADKLNPAGLPTVNWSPAGHIRDEYVIDLPPDMQPGEYQLTVGLWTCEGVAEGECGSGRLPVMDSEGREVGDAVPLGAIVVR